MGPIENSDVVKNLRTGCWALLYLQMPGSERRPAGLVLWDPMSDTLLMSVRELLADEKDQDVEEFWVEFPEFFASVISELGGLAALTWLESGSSHVVQIGIRTNAQIREPRSLLRSLFEQQVSLALKPRFGEQELTAAQAKLSVLPSIAVQIIAVLRTSNVDYRELERAISQDPVLTAHIIRIANYASLNVREPARALRSAIQRIGFDATKLNVFALIVGKMYSSPRLRKLWDHSVHAAHIARQLATAAGYSAEEAALVSLVHDIGQIVMYAIGAEFDSEYSRLRTSGLTNLAAEIKLCNLTHAEIGANLLYTWHFPLDLCEAVRYHHAPLQTESPFASLLYLAESWLEENEDIYNPLEHFQALERLNLAGTVMSGLRAGLDSDLQVLRAAA